MLDWNVFATLPGAGDRNFEIVTRAAVQHAFGRYGRLRGTRQQPGVEYYLRIGRPDCPLGDPPRVFGWQCKFYKEDAGYLDTNRRQAAENGIEKAVKYVDGITDFILWTRKPLREQDVTWLEEICATHGLASHSWHADDLEGLLTGDAETLRQTFFGDLVLTPESLAASYEESRAQVSDRHDHALHLRTREDHQLRRRLAEGPAWTKRQLRSVGPPERLDSAVEALRQSASTLPDSAHTLVVGSITAAQARAAFMATATTLVTNGDLQALREEFADLPPLLTDEQRDSLLREAKGPLLRSLNFVQAVAGISDSLLQQLVETVSAPLVAVVGPAGAGKTHLAAELAAPQTDRPAGVLVLARPFGAQVRDADLADALVSGQTDLNRALDALQATAKRHSFRLPIVLDGLNESDHPASWKHALARLATKLERRPELLAFVTVRPDYARFCLPADTPEHMIAGFTSAEVETAVERYFSHFKIEAELATLPWLELTNPLFLRIFCLAVNPHRERPVTLAELPPGLASVFERFIASALDQVHGRRGIDTDSVRGRLRSVGDVLWADNCRALSKPVAKELLGDDPIAWDKTLTQELLSEGVLRKEPAATGNGEMITPVFDALAGHVVGDALVAGDLPDFNDASVVNRLVVGEAGAHPFADDIVTGLDGLFAHAGAKPLWARTSDARLRRASLVGAVRLPGDQASRATLDGLVALAGVEPERIAGLLPRIVNYAGWVDEPFNAELLDRLLLPMDVAQRDLVWTEWVRRSSEIDDIIEIWEERYRSRDVGIEAGHDQEAWLGMLLLSWLLTSTDRARRDRATRALWTAGRVRPDLLFRLTLDRLDINDPYVSERLMAATYGVVMSNARPSDGFRAAAPTLLASLSDRLLAPDAVEPSSHWLIREHAKGIVDFSRKLHPELLPDRLARIDLGAVPAAEAQTLLPHERERTNEAREVLGMDFANYTIGQLSPDRDNYDNTHENHQRLVEEVQARVWDLGWRNERFARIDGSLARSASRHDNSPEKVERYGKKYSWIGFYEAAGREDAAGRLLDFDGSRDRISDLPIDPSFPEVSTRAPATVPSWVAAFPNDDARWVREGPVDIPSALLRVQTIDDHAGPWVATSGHLNESDSNRNDEFYRRVFAFIQLLLVPSGKWSAVSRFWKGRSTLSRDDFPRREEDYFTYAGEMPWADHFAPHSGAFGARIPSVERVAGAPSGRIPAEQLSHGYGWESHHSTANPVNHASVPSPAFSQAFGLVTEAGSLNQLLPDGTRASCTVNGPEGFDGDILYLREDLVRKYAARRDSDVGVVVWGERGVLGRRADRLNRSIADARRSGEDIHRLIVGLDQIRD